MIFLQIFSDLNIFDWWIMLRGKVFVEFGPFEKFIVVNFCSLFEQKSLFSLNWKAIKQNFLYSINFLQNSYISIPKNLKNYSIWKKVSFWNSICCSFRIIHFIFKWEKLRKSHNIECDFLNSIFPKKIKFIIMWQQKSSLLNLNFTFDPLSVHMMDRSPLF